MTRDLRSASVLAAFALLAAQAASGANLLNHYRFDSISAGTTPDATGASDGTINGGITVSSTAQLGNSLSFSGGTAEFVGIDDPADGKTLFTASLWMLPDTADLQGPLGHWNHPTGDRTVLIRTGSTGNLEIFADSDSTGQIGGGVAGLGAISTSQFNHVAITYDGQRLRTFLNGVESSTVHDFGTPLALGEMQFGTLAVGGRGGSERDYTGLIDDVAFFEEQLTFGQINAMINVTGVPDLQFDASQMDTLFDVFDGTLTAASVGGLQWTQASGLGGAAGDVIALPNNGFFINLDGTNGVLGIVPEPSSALLLSLGCLVLVRRRRGCPKA